VLVSEFNYFLPAELIAQKPLADRAGSRLLHLGSSPATPQDRFFREFPDLLRSGDLVVFNNTRVFPARLHARRSGIKAQRLSSRNPAARQFLRGRVEVLLTRQLSQEPNQWECLVRPGRKIGVGEGLFFGEQDELQAEVTGRGLFGERQIRSTPRQTSSLYWSGSAMFRFLRILTGLMIPVTGNVIKRSTRASAARSPLLRQVSTSRQKSSTRCES